MAADVFEPEAVAEYRAARETVLRIQRDEDVGPGDVGAAVNGLRAIYDHLLAERSAP